jgi:urocanate hydratase
MISRLRQGQTQSSILRAYTALYQLRSTWGGSLILSLGLDPEGAALSIAASIAGAVSLAIDNDPVHLREVVRTGAVDFTVTTLDEAIRAMKNELRKHSPLAVALNAEPIPTLAEILERGLAPQLFTSFLRTNPRINEAANSLHFIGATLINFTEASEPIPGIQSAQTILAPLLKNTGWTLHTFTFETAPALRTFDAKALNLLSPEDNLRRRWLESAPRILQRQRPPHRTLWLTESEAQALKGASITENPVKL